MTTFALGCSLPPSPASPDTKLSAISSLYPRARTSIKSETVSAQVGTADSAVAATTAALVTSLYVRNRTSTVCCFHIDCTTRNIQTDIVVGVFRDGGYAEYTALRVEALTRVPTDMDPAEVAPLFCAGVTTFSACYSRSRSSPKRD